MAFVNMSAIRPGAPGAAAMMEANTTAVSYSNEAVSLSKAGQFDRAAQLHQKALNLKIRAFGEESVQATISYNGLGECLLKAGKLDQAEAALRKALKVRDSKENGGLGLGPAMDSAVTRDNMGALFEAQGKFEEARQVRLSGAAEDEIACSNTECPGMTFARSQVKACGACHAAFYDTPACQKADAQSPMQGKAGAVIGGNASQALEAGGRFAVSVGSSAVQSVAVPVVW